MFRGEKDKEKREKATWGEEQRRERGSRNKSGDAWSHQELGEASFSLIASGKSVTLSGLA